MCLYPRLIINKKYTSTLKNGGNIPHMNDERIKYVPIGCGNCYECRKQKAQMWRVRLMEELKRKENEKPLFITLTFSEESLYKLFDKFSNCESNYIATKAIRLFLERWRKTKKKSLRHWLVTELGHQNTERLHLHGIIWTNETNEFIQNKWSYGKVDIHEYCNQITINYIVKYINKIDNDHKGYQSITLCSKGIGSNYNVQQNRFKDENTNETYRLNNGQKINLPIYYRNKIYNDDEREKLWLNKLDKGIQWINGIKVDADDYERIDEILTTAREKNKRLGYGDNSKEWNKRDYNVTKHMLNKLTRIEKERKNKELFYSELREKVKKKELKLLKNLHNNK